MSKATHTKTPWRIGRNGADYCVFAGDEKFIADCDRSDDMDGSPEDIANAAFIVRAVNSHAALVATLENILEFMEDKFHEFDGADSEAAAATEGIAGTMPAAMTGKADTSLSAGVAAPQQAATRVAPAAAPTPAPATSPPAARQTAVEAELMPDKPKRTRKAGTVAAPAEPVTVTQSVPAAAPPPPAAATDFDAMLDSILG